MVKITLFSSTAIRRPRHHPAVQMRQRPLGLVQGGGFARQPGLFHGVRAGRDHPETEGHRQAKPTGTLITFKPDPTIFTITTEFKFDMLAIRCGSWPS